MKKILILATLVLMASALFAQVTLGGRVEYGVQHPADADGTYGFVTSPDTRIEVTAKADDFSTGTIRMRLDTPAAGDVRFDRAHFTTNYLAAFGAANEMVGVSGTFGLNEWNIANVANIIGDYDPVSFGKAFTSWGTRQTVTVMNMVTLAAAFDLTRDTLSNMNVNLTANVPIPGVGSARAEVAYILLSPAAITRPMGEGSMVFGARFDFTGVPNLTVAAGVGYDLEMRENTDGEFGANVRVAYALAPVSVYGGVGFRMDVDSGDEDEILGVLSRDPAVANNMWVPVVLGGEFAGLVGFDVGILLDLTEEDARLPKIGVLPIESQGVFDSLDVSAFVRAGRATFRLGYLFVPENETALDHYRAESSVTLTGGVVTAASRGLYFNASMAF